MYISNYLDPRFVDTWIMLVDRHGGESETHKKYTPSLQPSAYNTY